MDVRTEVLCFVLLWCSSLTQVSGLDDSIVFPGKTSADDNKKSLTPEDAPLRPKSATDQSKDGIKPRFGLDSNGVSFNFGVQPSNGGISGTASFSNSYGGQGHSGSQSQSFNFQAGTNGFSASQSGSQSSSFNSNIPGYYGTGGTSISASQASSQASSFSGGPGGNSGSAASSQASSFGFQGSGVNVGGSSSSSNSNSFSGSQGRPGGGFGYSPSAGSSGSNSQSGGASFGGSYGGYPNEYLDPDYIRYYNPGNRRNTSYRRRKPNNWYGISVGTKSGIVFPS